MLTIVIPTRNRPLLLRNQLAYFAKMKLPFKILLVDASDDDLFEETARNLDCWRSGLNVEHYKALFVDSNYATKRIHLQLLDGLERVDSPLACILPDDDFYIPAGLKKIVEMMSRYPELGMGTGRSLAVVSPGIGKEALDNVKFTRFRQADLPWDDPMTRICNHLSYFTGTAFAVHRREILRNSLLHASDVELPSFLMEALQSSIAVAQGPVKRVDDLYLIRHSHDRGGSSTADLKKESLDIFSPDFHRNMDKFAMLLRNALIETGILVGQDFRNRLWDAFSFLVVQKRLQRYVKLPSERISEVENFQPLFDACRTRTSPVWQSIAASLEPITQNILTGLADKRVLREGV